MEDTIFNFIDSILHNNKKLNVINEDETQFNLYMLNRWCSMADVNIVNLINETANKYGKIFDSKQDQYNFVFNLYPKIKKKKIEYIKKQKEKKEEDESIKHLAKSYELSEREIKNIINFI
jgi:K+/H+ antiporter YhaU regulatory subunit KhtT